MVNIMSEADRKKMKQLEKKLATLSVLNSALKAENDELKDLVSSQGTGPLDDDEQEVEELKQEFAERLDVIETKLLQVTDERDGLRAELRSVQGETHTKVSKLKERDDTINELQEEGQKLARRIGELEGTTRKLRSDLEQESAENGRLTEQLDLMKTGLKNGQVIQGEEMKDYETRLKFLTEELTQERSKQSSTASHLKKDYEDRLKSCEEQLKEQHKMEVVVLKEREYKLVDQVQRLQDSLVELETSTADREESIRKENRFLEYKCQQLDTKMIEMSNSFTEQTKPYLLEIENLKTKAMRASETSEKIEMELRAKVAGKENDIRILEGKLLAAETIAVSTEEAITKFKHNITDANEQLEQEHQKVIAALRKEAEMQEDIEKLKDENLLLQKSIHDMQHTHERTTKDLVNERQNLEQKFSGIIRTNEEVISRQKLELESASEKDLPSAEEDLDSSGLAGLLQDSSAKFKFSLGRPQYDQDGEMQSLSERLRTAEEMRQKSMDDCSKAMQQNYEYQNELKELGVRYDTAVILIGENEEKIDQLEDDIKEMKQIFHDQISIMADELQRARR